MILVTGSRAGLVLGALAAAWCFVQYRAERAAETGGRVFSLRYLAIGLASVAAIGGLFAYMAFSRAEALQRLLSNGNGNGEVELRYENLRSSPKWRATCFRSARGSARSIRSTDLRARQRALAALPQPGA